MTLSEQTEKRVYERLRAFDGLEVAGHEPVDSSIASVLSEGEVLADNGEQYSSIQNAVDASDSWTFVGPGTYYENVVIDKDDFTLQGAGYDTLIDGGDVDHALTVAGSNITVSSVRCRTPAQSEAPEVIATGSGADNTVFESVSVTSGNVAGMLLEHGSGHIIDNYYVTNIVNDRRGIRARETPELIIINSEFDESDMTCISFRGCDDCIIANNIIEGGNGILLGRGSVNCNDNIVIGNRITANSGDGIDMKAGIDNILANNRIDATDNGIENTGTGTVTDGNLTGAAN